MDVRRMIRHEDGLAGFIMGNHGLRARHNAAQHSDVALVHCEPAPIANHVPIDIDALPHMLR